MSILNLFKISLSKFNCPNINIKLINFSFDLIIKLFPLSLLKLGIKITKKKNITTMQNLRNLKFKKYPFWRFDKKNLQTIHGGWHFSFLQTPEQILNKIKSFSSIF